VTLADARSRHAPRAFFLAADPHVPLAVVSRGRVRQAVREKARGKTCGNRDRWASIGSRWRALDAWGQILGTRTVAGKDNYDVTACAELGFSDTRPDDLQRFLVSVDSAWRPSASVEWAPSTGVRAAFDRVLTREAPDASISADRAPSQCAGLGRTQFFQRMDLGRYGVGGSNSGYVIARLVDDQWSVMKVERSSGGDPFPTSCYRPLAVFDMNGDGRPEVVLRESEGASWGDFVLGEDADGRWKTVASSPGGATI
jgi:hypothetical protein